MICIYTPSLFRSEPYFIRHGTYDATLTIPRFSQALAGTYICTAVLLSEQCTYRLQIESSSPPVVENDEGFVAEVGQDSNEESEEDTADKEEEDDAEDEDDVEDEDDAEDEVAEGKGGDDVKDEDVHDDNEEDDDDGDDEKDEEDENEKQFGRQT